MKTNILVQENSRNISKELIFFAGILITVAFIAILGADQNSSGQGRGPYEATALGNNSYVITNTQSGSSRVFLVSPDGKIKGGETITRN